MSVAAGTPINAETELRLKLAADMLDDIEGLRIATQNRVRSATMSGLPAGAYEAQLGALAEMEKRATLDLKRALRMHPLGPWVKRTVGLGEKQGGRLIAAVGDPAWNYAEDRARRGPAELWAYCGYDPAQRRRKGVKNNWNADAKMRARLCAEKAQQAGVRQLDGVDDTDGYDVEHRKAITHYGEVYLASRRNDLDATHTEACPQCGPKGKPAEPGSPLSKGHQEARALRKVAKEILKDMWKASTADRRATVTDAIDPRSSPGVGPSSRHAPGDTHRP